MHCAPCSKNSLLCLSISCAQSIHGMPLPDSSDLLAAPPTQSSAPSCSTATHIDESATESATTSKRFLVSPAARISLMSAHRILAAIYSISSSVTSLNRYSAATSDLNSHRLQSESSAMIVRDRQTSIIIPITHDRHFFHGWDFLLRSRC